MEISFLQIVSIVTFLRVIVKFPLTSRVMSISTVLDILTAADDLICFIAISR